MGSNLLDEIDCASFFDQIDDLIDFPPDDNERENIGIGGDLVNSGDCNDLPSMWNGALPDSDDIFSNNSASDLSAEISVPHEEIAQLEWLSTFVDDSFSDVGLNIKEHDLTCPLPNKKDSNFRTSSPVSVLESSSSNNIPRCGPQRARSKRPRPPAFNPRPPMIQLVEVTENLSESSSSDPTKNVPELLGPKQKQKKQKMMKKSDEIGRDVSPQATNVRKCLHCEITKTPQWRAGPMGPKTLCNACGVRFKSGRLFPEYRPAASPTFVPTVHSNSHKKVLEMRNKAGPQGGDVKPEDLVTNNA